MSDKIKIGTLKVNKSGKIYRNTTDFVLSQGGQKLFIELKNTKLYENTVKNPDKHTATAK